MKLPIYIANKFDWLYSTLSFIKVHANVLIGLGLVAAFGRVIQLGGFGQITSWMNIVLEIVIESARLLLFLFVLGSASIKNVASRIWRFILFKKDRKLYLSSVNQKLKKQWLVIIFNIGGLLLITSVINYLIDLLAYQTCLLLELKKNEILAGTASEWTILLFFKIYL